LRDRSASRRTAQGFTLRGFTLKGSDGIVRRSAMKHLSIALCVMMLATGLALAAGEGERRPEPPRGPGEGDRRPEPARRPGEFNANSIQNMLQRNKEMVARWEEALGKAHAEETKKFLGEAIEKGKYIESTLEKASAALQAQKEDEARELLAEVREKQADFMKYAAAVPTYLEMDRVRTMQERRGKGDPELNARCDKVVDLLKKKLELQSQIAAVDIELYKERRALLEPREGVPGRAPGAEPPRRPEAKPEEAK
jgi:hypothetical protein